MGRSKKGSIVIVIRKLNSKEKNPDVVKEVERTGFKRGEKKMKFISC